MRKLYAILAAIFFVATLSSCGQEEQLKQQISDLEAKNAELQAQVDELTKEKAELEAKLQEIKETAETAATETATTPAPTAAPKSTTQQGKK